MGRHRNSGESGERLTLLLYHMRTVDHPDKASKFDISCSGESLHQRAKNSRFFKSVTTLFPLNIHQRRCVHVDSIGVQIVLGIGNVEVVVSSTGCEPRVSLNGVGT